MKNIFFILMFSVIYASYLTAETAGGSNAPRETKHVFFDISLIPPVQIFNFPGKTIDGLQINLIYGSTYNLNGLGTGVINHAENDINGADIGVLNISGAEFRGIEAAIINLAKNGCGLQAGIFNSAKYFAGLQYGTVNIAENVCGVQIGLINVCDDINGLPLGFLNFVKKGHIDISINAASKTLFNFELCSGKDFYSIFTCGIHGNQNGLDGVPINDREDIKFGEGIGVRIGEGAGAFRLEITNNYAERRDESTGGTTAAIHYIEFKILPGIGSGRFGLFFGPTIKYFTDKRYADNVAVKTIGLDFDLGLRLTLY
jgi:hypothetical protein